MATFWVPSCGRSTILEASFEPLWPLSRFAYRKSLMTQFQKCWWGVLASILGQSCLPRYRNGLFESTGGMKDLPCTSSKSFRIPHFRTRSYWRWLQWHLATLSHQVLSTKRTKFCSRPVLSQMCNFSSFLSFPPSCPTLFPKRVSCSTSYLPYISSRKTQIWEFLPRRSSMIFQLWTKGVYRWIPRNLARIGCP